MSSNVSSTGFTAREGDVLVISYPEVKIPVSKYWTLGVGNLIYTRKLIAGDNPDDQYDRIYGWLKNKAEQTAVEKIKRWSAEAAGVDHDAPAAPRRPRPESPVAGGRP